MKLLIVTPLYPPDIGNPAPHIKELTKRLAVKHQITVISYQKFPEKIPGVTFISINKQQPLPLRLISFTLKLRQAIQDADVAYVENGASVELPLGIITPFLRKPFIIHVGDNIAHSKMQKNSIIKFIINFMRSRAISIITQSPNVRPEILPYMPHPTEEIKKYEESWEMHMDILKKYIFP